MSSLTNQTIGSIDRKTVATKPVSYSKVKGVLSSGLGLLTMVVAVTGIGLFVAPHGPMASKSWTFAGMTVPLMKDVHIWLGFGMVALVLGHFALNLRTLIGELKQLFW
ncbi:DUF4405 domain-containing protein [Heliobacterium chlorum]|uniref:DUF4405 domain-containing protein n=1 Tax=Heliobacterium chlorum TaxID=2698 RepID=A0ABR7T8W3_HELCL|nr:DUF4405 domain-containing protein [Heliobacterium chlorum]MBC9786251.1 DUF4405 domain-containing protein [Heliobacterium chlorum]